MPMRRLVNVIYALSVEGLDAKSRARLDDQLDALVDPDPYRPPVVEGRKAPAWWQGEEAAAIEAEAVLAHIRGRGN
jgi:hypothetical protein